MRDATKKTKLTQKKISFVREYVLQGKNTLPGARAVVVDCWSSRSKQRENWGVVEISFLIYMILFSKIDNPFLN